MSKARDALEALFRAKSSIEPHRGPYDRWFNLRYDDIKEVILRALGQEPAPMIPWLLSVFGASRVVRASPHRVVGTDREGYQITTYSGGTATLPHPYPPTIAGQQELLRKSLAKLTKLNQTAVKQASETPGKQAYRGAESNVGWAITHDLDSVALHPVFAVERVGQQFRVWLDGDGFPRYADATEVTDDPYKAVSMFYSELNKEIERVRPAESLTKKEKLLEALKVQAREQEEQARRERAAEQERIAATSFVWSASAEGKKGEAFLADVETYNRDLLPYIKRTTSMIRLTIPPTAGSAVRYAAHSALAEVSLNERNRFDAWANASGGLDSEGRQP